jgi:hypothetical protein
MIEGDVEVVSVYAARLLAMNKEYETFLGRLEGTIFHAWAVLRVRPEPALLDEMQASIDALERAQHRAFLPFFMTRTADVTGAYGDRNSARRLLDRAAALVGHTGERWSEADLLRVTAQFAASDAERVSLLDSAIAIACAQGARLWGLRAANELAGILATRGELDRARQMLDAACDAFPDEAASPDLKHGRALLATIP